MEEKYEKFLPVGTVVLLKGATKKVMITGFLAKDNNTKTLYDYSASLYPEGFLSSDQILLFNHDQISKIFYLGMYADEAKELKKKLLDYVKSHGE